MREVIEGMSCPTCDDALVREVFEGGSRPTCPRCAGCAVTVSLLRRIAPRERVNEIWNAAAREGPTSPRACPSCSHAMRLGRVAVEGATIEIDACRRCQLLWFDGSELETFSPERQEPDPDAPDPSAESHARWMKKHRRQMHDRLTKTLDQMAHGRGLGGF